MIYIMRGGNDDGYDEGEDCVIFLFSCIFHIKQECSNTKHNRTKITISLLFIFEVKFLKMGVTEAGDLNFIASTETY